MTFSTIQGHFATKESLVSAVKSKSIPHAQLFFGIEGSASFPLALAMMGYMLCENKNASDRCGQCGACLKFSKHIHPDVNYVFPVASKGTTKKESETEKKEFEDRDHWRQFLLINPYPTLSDWNAELGEESKQLGIHVHDCEHILKKAYMKPYEAPMKFFLIWLPETMQSAAANRLLKVVEEPPANTYFIFITENIDQLLLTIISRTQIIRIKPFTSQEIVDQLKIIGDTDSTDLENIAQMANGSMAAAYRLIETTGDAIHDQFRNWMNQCASQKYTELSKLSDSFTELSKENQKNLLLYGLKVAREVMLIKLEVEQLVKVPTEQKDFLRKFAGAFGSDTLEELNLLFNKYLYSLERNANARMAFMDCSLRIAELLDNR